MDRALHYELTCPSCGHAQRLSFVRVGAVADCSACGHRYQVDQEQLRHFHLEEGVLSLSTTARDRSASPRKLGRIFNKLTGTRVAWGAAAASPLVILTGFFLASHITTSEPSSRVQPAATAPATAPAVPALMPFPASPSLSVCSPNNTASDEVPCDSPADILSDAKAVDASQRMAGTPALPLAQ